MSGKPVRGYFDGVINRHPLSFDRAVQRASWLAELAIALDRATQLTLELCDYCAGGKEAGVLRGRILNLRDEVDAMQKRRRPHTGEIRPQWM